MLIIVESPAKAKTIGKIVGNKHTVKASVGHIRRISNDKKTKDGKKLEINGIDIDNDFKPIFEVDEGKKKVVTELKKLAKEADGILLATDEDREGEAISWHLAEVLKLDPTKVKRLVFHEITKSALEKALDNPRNLDLQMVSAQQARQVLDKLVGYKLSPVLWRVMSNNHLSAGRVQSPALRIIRTRELEIQNFNPEEYWEVYGLFNKDEVKTTIEYIHKEEPNFPELKKDIELRQFLKLTQVAGKKTPKTINSETEVKDLLQGLENHTKFTVQKIQLKEEKRHPKPPFTTSTYQQAASSRLGMTPKQAMSAAQKLYEGVPIDGSPTALITYMRTDSLNLSNESINSARNWIKGKYPKFLPSSANYYKSKSQNAQEAHEAIRPTDPSRTPDSLKGKIDNNLWRAYDLIWRQMVASQMTPEIKERQSFDLQNDRHDVFSGSVARTISKGFRAVLETADKSDQELKYSEGQILNLEIGRCLQNFTSPPSRYSPASLIKKLEEEGIGRPSTYATIISTLVDRTYAELTKNILYPTVLGMRVGELLEDNFEHYTSSALTAEMEDNLDKISHGKKKYEEVLSEFWKGFSNVVEGNLEKVAENRNKYRQTQTDVLDPKHGDPMVLKIGRFGEYYQNPNHLESIYPKNFRELAVAESEAHEKFDSQAEGKSCTECGKGLIVRVSKSSLKPYIACPEYKVGNNHTVTSVNYGPCPKCQKEGRDGMLTLRSYKGRQYYGCSLDKKVCGYTENLKKKKDGE